MRMASPAATNQEQTTGQQQQQNHLLAAAQRQQQELIKLLAQHFHHQFYQLANNNAAQRSAQEENQQQQQQQLQQEYRSQLVHHFPNGDNQSIANPLTNNGLNLMQNAHEQQQRLLQANVLRSLHSGLNLTGSNGNQESLADFLSSSNTLINYPAPNEMNLFGALGLNAASNQLVLSLHQQQQHQHQSLLQAAAARQYENMGNQLNEQQRNHHQATSRDLIISNEASFRDFSNVNQRDNKDLLKFSINTILGQNSPKLNLNLETRISTNLSDETTRLSNSNEETTNKVNIDERTDRLSTMTESDQLESSSDTSSISAPAHLAQSSSSSVLFNQGLNPDYCPPSSRGTGNSLNQRSVQQISPAHHHNHHSHPLPFLAGAGAFPWTVAARGKPRRGMMRRAVFSDSQRVGLEKRFQLQKYISKPDRKKLAEKLGLRDSQVKIWFQNRRMKWRNSKERELLSAGGSREQTLPTRNNPNPDLSDVGETIKRNQTSTTTAPVP